MSTYEAKHKKYQQNIKLKPVSFDTRKLKDQERLTKLANLPDGVYSARVKAMIDSWPE